MDQKIELLLNFLEENKAKNIALFDTQNFSTEQKAIIIANFSNCVDNKNFADLVMKEFGLTEFPEGYHKGEWIIFVLDDVVLHTFIPLKREKYNLDKLYQNAKVPLNAKK